MSVASGKKKSKEDESKVVDLHRVLVAVVASLLNSTCSNLRKYAVNMLECHRERWIVRLEKQLEEDLEALHFPQCIIDLDQVSLTTLISKSKAIIKTIVHKFKNLRAENELVLWIEII